MMYSRFLILLLVILITESKMSHEGKFISVDFEIYGRVQGVFFRKYTQKQAEKLGLSGYCMNTEYGTVQGSMQGPSDKVADMRQWLETVGSPQSKIEKAVFSNQIMLKSKPTSTFTIRR